jgi:hypothetical protein
MTWVQADYDAVKVEMQPGDVIAFAGKDGISGWIMAATNGPVSHVGVLLRASQGTDDASATYVSPQIIESGKDLNEHYGVSPRWLDERVASFDGKMWWLPLSDDVRSRLDVEAFTTTLAEKEDLPYDAIQAVQSAADALDHDPLLGGLTYSREDFSAFFCSELVAAGLEAGGAIRSINCSEVTPLDVVRFAIYRGTYYQLKGPKTLLSGYNTLDPEGWGEQAPAVSSGAVPPTS